MCFIKWKIYTVHDRPNRQDREDTESRRLQKVTFKTMFTAKLHKQVEDTNPKLSSKSTTVWLEQEELHLRVLSPNISPIQMLKYEEPETALCSQVGQNTSKSACRTNQSIHSKL